MSSIPAMNAGLLGIQRGMKGIRQNAHEIANAKSVSNTQDQSVQSAGVNDVTQPLVEIKLYKLQVEASAKVVQTTSDLIGTLLDIKT